MSKRHTVLINITINFSALALLPFPEQHQVSLRADIIEASFHELPSVFYGFGNRRMVFVFLETDQLSIDQGVLDVAVSKPFHDVKDVLGFVVFHRSMPMSESVHVDA